MSILSVILLLFGNVLFRVYRHQTLLTVATHQSSTWLRMARTLRADLHAARCASLSGDDSAELVLADDGGSTRWTINGSEVRRLSASGNERFVLPNARLKFELVESEKRQLARLTAAAMPLADPSLPPSSGVIEIAVGLDRRWEGGQP